MENPVSEGVHFHHGEEKKRGKVLREPFDVKFVQLRNRVSKKVPRLI